jgi:hypothetical protein
MDRTLRFQFYFTKVSNAKFVRPYTMLLHPRGDRDLASYMSPRSSTQSAVIHSLSAGGAGTIASLVTHPFDVIKVRFEPPRGDWNAELESSQTKIQVRGEDRYQSFSKAARTVWIVSLSNVSNTFSPECVADLATGLQGFLRWRVVEADQEGFDVCCIMGSV